MRAHCARISGRSFTRATDRAMRKGRRSRPVPGWLEPISKSPEEDEEASEVDEAEEVLRIELPADQQASAPLNPGEEAFDQPAPCISAEPSAILCERVHPI